MSASPNNPALGSAKSTPLVPPVHSPASRPFPVADHRDLETLLALSSLHEQIRRRRTQELNKGGRLGPEDSWELKQFAHDEVLQLVAERAVTVTGADGVAVALVDGTGIVCRASAGKIAPELGARLDPYSGFSGACLRTGAILRCDDSDKDNRVNPESCRRLGTRSMVAVPLSTPEAIIGVLEAFSTEPFGFNDSDVRSLNLLSELILDAMKPEDEIRLAEISQKVVRAGFEPVPGRTPALAAPPKPPELEPSIVPAATNPQDSSPPRDSSNFPSWRNSERVKQNARLVFFSEYDQVETSRPGLKLVIMLVMLAVALGVGLWWQIRHNIHLNAAHTNRLPIKTAPTQTAQISSPQEPDIAEPSSPRIGNETKADSAAIESPGDPQYPEITGIRHWSSPTSSTVVIDLEDQVQYEAHRLTGPERIYFDLLDTKLAHGLFGKIIEVNDPVLQRIRVAQPKQGVTRVVLDTKGASNYSVSMEQEPFRLVVEVGKLGSKVGPNSKINLFGPNQPADPSTALSNTANFPQAESAIDQASSISSHADPSKPPTASLTPGPTIVLDAGHGGWDLGTVGSKGLEEKDLVLDIVQQLGALLEKKLNAKVVYTRPDDSYVALEKRAEIANLSKANLFISIHANYSGSASARGVETYYTNTYSSIKARTPDADGEGYLQNVDWTRVDIREKVQESHRLADCVQQALYGTVKSKNPGIRDRGVKEAQYVVLTGTSMPAILAEVSFVSSPADESELQNAAYRQRIAEALYKGIARYRDTPRHSTIASLQ